MRKVDIHDASKMRSRLIKAAESGEDVVLTRANRPVAVLTNAGLRRHGVKFRTMKGTLERVSEDFNKPLFLTRAELGESI